MRFSRWIKPLFVNAIIPRYETKSKLHDFCNKKVYKRGDHSSGIPKGMSAWHERMRFRLLMVCYLLWFIIRVKSGRAAI